MIEPDNRVTEIIFTQSLSKIQHYFFFVLYSKQTEQKEWISVKEAKCGSCEFFLQHYIIDRRRCSTVNCGHCTYSRIKKRTPDMSACEHYVECTERGLPDRAEVIHYLTTDFLKEILNMALPPEIGEDEGFD